MPNKKIGFLIKQVYILHEQQLNKRFSQFGLTASQTFTLVHLLVAREHDEQVTQKDLEKRFDISNPTVTGIINRLEAKGLVKRIPCKHDARSKYIVVTDKAIELDKELRKAFEAADQELVTALNENEINELSQYLIKILRNHS